MANDTKKNEKGNTGNRYTDEQRKEILDFYNAQTDENGEIKRGTVKATQDKFGVSYIALRNWLKGSSEKKAPKRGRPKKTEDNTEKGKRGRKANPSIFVMRQLEKLKTQAERNLNSITKAMEKISGK